MRSACSGRSVSFSVTTWVEPTASPGVPASEPPAEHLACAPVHVRPGGNVQDAVVQAPVPRLHRHGPGIEQTVEIEQGFLRLSVRRRRGNCGDVVDHCHAGTSEATSGAPWRLSGWRKEVWVVLRSATKSATTAARQMPAPTANVVKMSCEPPAAMAVPPRAGPRNAPMKDVPFDQPK